MPLQFCLLVSFAISPCVHLQETCLVCARCSFSSQTCIASPQQHGAGGLWEHTSADARCENVICVTSVGKKSRLCFCSQMWLTESDEVMISEFAAMFWAVLRCLCAPYSWCLLLSAPISARLLFHVTSKYLAPVVQMQLLSHSLFSS
jgi:hypothetical protein